MRFHRCLAGLALVLCAGLAAAKVEKPAKDAPARLQFNRDVRPILSDACFHCHGPDRSKRKAGLRLDTEEGRSALVPGRPDASELIARITSADPHTRMPPAKSGRSLSPAQVDLLRRWVAEGAAWQPHWA